MVTILVFFPFLLVCFIYSVKACVALIFWFRQAMGLHQAIALCVEHCHSADLACDSDWYKTIVLSGGTACLPGLAGKYSFLFVT